MSKFRPGFTIVELLIVITIMAGFIAIGSFGFIRLKEAAEFQHYENTARNLVSSLDESYLSGIAPNGDVYEKGSYPPIAPRSWGLNDISRYITSYYDSFNYDEQYDKSYAYGAEKSDPDDPYPEYTENGMIDALYYWNAFIYQPLTKNNELCRYSNSSSEPKICTKFNF